MSKQNFMENLMYLPADQAGGVAACLSDRQVKWKPLGNGAEIY